MEAFPYLLLIPFLSPWEKAGIAVQSCSSTAVALLIFPEACGLLLDHPEVLNIFPLKPPSTLYGGVSHYSSLDIPWLLPFLYSLIFLWIPTLSLLFLTILRRGWAGLFLIFFLNINLFYTCQIQFKELDYQAVPLLFLFIFLLDETYLIQYPCHFFPPPQPFVVGISPFVHMFVHKNSVVSALFLFFGGLCPPFLSFPPDLQVRITLCYSWFFPWISMLSLLCLHIFRLGRAQLFLCFFTNIPNLTLDAA